MIWPANLVTCVLFNTLHSQYYAGMGTRGGISRERFFFYGFLASFCWYFVPGYLFAALSFTNWVCWIVPNNIIVNQLFGTVSGLGMSLITFDWNQIAYIGSPLATPWWAEANIAFGMVFFFCMYPVDYSAMFALTNDGRDNLPSPILHKHLVLQVHAHLVDSFLR
jgi:hypothetical protein